LFLSLAQATIAWLSRRNGDRILARSYRRSTGGKRAKKSVSSRALTRRVLPALSDKHFSAYCLVREPSPFVSLGRLFMRRTLNLVAAAFSIILGTALPAASPAEQQLAAAIKAQNLSVVHHWAPWCSNCQAE